MAAFIEPLLQEQLWHWLETEKGMKVDSEVRLENGRIDLAAETPEGRYIGIEVKRGGGVGIGTDLYEQVHRYIESGVFDKIYFASWSVDSILRELSGDQRPDVGVLSKTSRRIRAGIQAGEVTVEEAKSRIEAELPDNLLDSPTGSRPRRTRPYIFKKLTREVDESLSAVSLDEGVKLLQRARCPTELGVIHVPLNLSRGDDGRILRDLEQVHHPDRAYQPIIRREAEQLDRTAEPEFSRHQEPWVRHCVWKEFGGLPEGYIPNVRTSDQPFRPIDLLTFAGGYDPTVILESGKGTITGIEAKGEGSFDQMRLSTQLTEFLTTNTLTHLYLAVPDSLEAQAAALLDVHEEGDCVGLLTVSEDGSVSTARSAPQLQHEHDGYMRRYEPQKLGYGGIAIEGGRDVISPYVTSEESERLRYTRAEERARELIADSSSLADESGWITGEPPKNLYPPESEFDKEGTARAYLLQGSVAAPYADEVSSSDGKLNPREGYVRLSLKEYEVDGEPALKLHFGKGSWEGGYICLVGEQVQRLITVLGSLETIHGGSIPGQGKYIDLQTFPFSHPNNMAHKLSGAYGSEKPLVLDVSTTEEEAGSVARMKLGEGMNQGVDVTLTEPQWLDLLASVAILHEGNRRQLPGQHRSYPRIGPSGDNTWQLGTDVEK